MGELVYLMFDRVEARKGFLLEGSPARIRRLAATVEAVCEPLATGDAAAVRKKLDEVSWLIEWAVPGEAPDIQAELVELQKLLPEWRSVGQGDPARMIARDRVVAWAERLRWLSALLEATS
jgi:hypothetical protein